MQYFNMRLQSGNILSNSECVWKWLMLFFSLKMYWKLGGLYNIENLRFSSNAFISLPHFHPKIPSLTSILSLAEKQWGDIQFLSQRIDAHTAINFCWLDNKSAVTFLSALRSLWQPLCAKKYMCTRFCQQVRMLVKYSRKRKEICLGMCSGITE